MRADTSPQNLPSRWVTCPACAGPSHYASSNVYRPFCSERCKLMDLGAWASEQFAVPAPAEPDTFSGDIQ